MLLYTISVARTSILQGFAQRGGASVELCDNGVRRSGRRGGGEAGRREESGGVEKLLGCDEAVSTGLLEAVTWRMVWKNSLLAARVLRRGGERRGGGEGVEGVMNGVSGLSVDTQTLLLVTSQC